MEPPWTKRWWGNLDEADDDPDERFLSHGIRELASALPFAFAV